jgi:GTP-binding protein
MTTIDDTPALDPDAGLTTSDDAPALDPDAGLTTSDDAPAVDPDAGLTTSDDTLAVDPDDDFPTPPPEYRAVSDATPMVAIIGRPNVGKSSLFNRVLSRRHAIVSEVAGTTRDRLISRASWKGRPFLLVDTGGLEDDPEGNIPQRVQQQADMAMGAADVIVFLTDAIQGLTATDEAVAQRLRRTDKPVILAVNKVDNDNRELAASEFYALGLTETAFISAYHNYGIYDLLERMVELLPPPELADLWDYEAGQSAGDFDSWPDDEDASDSESEVETLPAPPTEMRLAIVGRTNVGKSLLTNTIIGEERSIVSPIAGTTRDALDTEVSYRDHIITLVDTAGIRRPGQIERGIERYSVLRAVNAVRRSDITLLITDATEIATSQDAHIAGLAWDTSRGLIVVVNKWDLVNRNRFRMERVLHRVQERLHFMSYVPVCFTSALTGEGMEDLLDTAISLWQERQKRVPYRELQYLLADAVSTHTPPSQRGNIRNRLRIRRVRQVGVNPPTFAFSVNDPKLVHFSYRRFLENQIRNRFGFDRTHLRLIFRPERENRTPRSGIRSRPPSGTRNAR